MLGKDVHKGIRRAKRTLALQGEADLFALDGARPVFIICDSGFVLVCFVVSICAPERNIQAIAESHTGRERERESVCVCVCESACMRMCMCVHKDMAHAACCPHLRALQAWWRGNCLQSCVLARRKRTLALTTAACECAQARERHQQPKE